MLLFTSFSAFSQSSGYPFKSGETALYGAYYNWHFIWIHSGEVEFNADTLEYRQQKAWHLKAVGKTFKAYDLLYSVRDTFETYCQYSDFQPMFSRRAMNHARSHSDHRYTFNISEKKVDLKIEQAKAPVFLKTIAMQQNTWDLLATAYHFRKFDFNSLFVGQKVPYRMLVDRDIDNLYFRYLGKENVKTRNGKLFRCHKVSVYLLDGDFFREGEYMKVWFTDDDNRLPIQVETEILVGTVKALLLEAKSLKYPLKSQIK